MVSQNMWMKETTGTYRGRYFGPFPRHWLLVGKQVTLDLTILFHGPCRLLRFDFQTPTSEVHCFLVQAPYVLLLQFGARS